MPFEQAKLIQYLSREDLANFACYEDIRRFWVNPDNGDLLVDLEETPYVDWDYYFFQIAYAWRRTRDELTIEMNKALAKVGVLCDFKPGVWGIMVDSMDISHFSRMDGRHYFSRLEYAHGYLSAAINDARAKECRDFIFRVC